jgi:hypothetical protein
MNLIQIQDKLKSLPNDPRVMQMLTAYANGQNPQVPPYLALGELNRRKGEMERAQMEQAGQPPGGTVKDQIEQQAGVMALKQGQQQQAMQRMAQQGMQGAAPVPQGVPQPQPQTQAMAAGGLASLRPGYRSGGIIAFQEAGSVNKAVEKEGEFPTDEREVYARLMREAELKRKTPLPTQEDYFKRQQRLIKENPEMLGALKEPIGQSAMARLEELQAARRAELALQKEELAKSKPGILQLLGQAAMNSRGQQGRSALASILGGYSELSSGADTKQLQQEQALRMKELEFQQAKADALNKVDEAKRAYAEGNMGKYEAYMKEARDTANKHGISMNSLLGDQVRSASQQLVSKDSTTQSIADRNQRIETERLNRESQERINRARIADRPFNAIEQQYILQKTGDKVKDAALLQRLVQENAEGRKPGLDMELLKKFENLPGVKADLDMLSVLRTQSDPKPKTLTKIKELEDKLAAKARNNSIDPARIGINSAAPVESVGAPPPNAVRLKQ